MISHSLNTIFIHINKNAGSSIQNAFHNAMPDKIPPINFANSNPPNHETAIMIKDGLSTKKWENYFKFAFVRNPWDRMVSMYHFRTKVYKAVSQRERLILQSGSFSDWILWSEKERNNEKRCNPLLPLWGPQLDWIKEIDGSIAIDFIGRFETINNDWDYICNKLDKNLKLPYYNATKHHHYAEYYDDTSRYLVEEWHKDDIEMFDYKFTPDKCPKLLL